MNLPDAHTHSSTAASGTAPRFICGTSPADWKQVALLGGTGMNIVTALFSAFIPGS